MNRAAALLAGAGLGAGLMYLLDPDLGRRRRAIARDKAVRLAHETQDTAEVVARDMQNRAQGLASGDLSVLAGGRQALGNPLRGSWSPSARALMTVVGSGLFLYGLTRNAPTACILGCVGLALAAEGITNAGIDDITALPHKMTDMATDAAASLAFGERSRHNGRGESVARPADARL
jgi:hypothetical protein